MFIRIIGRGESERREIEIHKTHIIICHFSVGMFVFEFVYHHFFAQNEVVGECGVKYSDCLEHAVRALADKRYVAFSVEEAAA